MQTFFAESMQMLFKKQPKVSRHYVVLTKSEAFTEAHKIARNMCKSVKYQQRFSAAYKKVLKENCVLLKKKNTLDYYVHAESNKSFHVSISAYSAEQAIEICSACGFFEEGEALQASTYLGGGINETTGRKKPSYRAEG